MHGWALSGQGPDAAVLQIREGLSALASGNRLFRPYYAAYLAEVLGEIGQCDEALAVLGEAIETSRSFQLSYWDSAFYRLKGELLLARERPDTAAAEACFREAIEIAQSQEAKSLELRAATSLARLWGDQGKRAEAHDRLAPVYDWFTEGFDTADLKDAKALLDQLR